MENEKDRFGDKAKFDERAMKIAILLSKNTN